MRDERIDDAGGRRLRTIERRDQRRDRVFVAKLPERFGRLGADEVVAQQRHEARRDRGIADPRQRVERGKRQEEVARLGDRRQPLDRGGGPSLPSASIA